MFAAIAPAYDLNNRLHSFGRDQAWRRRAVRLAGVGRGDDVLDVACGTGDLAEAFADARPRSVTGLDLTEPMLQIARAKAQRRTRPPGTPVPEYVRGDAMRLPFADGSFDVVSIAFGIRNVEDARKALGEFRRVMRGGGRVVILEFSEPTNGLLRRLNGFYCRQILPRTAALIARDRTGAYRYLRRSIETFASRAEMIEMLRAAGFEDVAAHPMTFGVCVSYVGHLRG